MTTSRRDLLQRAGSAAVLYKFVKGGSQLKAMAKNDTISFGFIGVGIRGMYLLEEFQKLPGTKMVIAADVYDGHLMRAKEVTNGTIGTIETTRDYRKVIERKDLDAIVIATPDHWHKQMALEALDAGKHVYLEKPMCWSIDQCFEVAQAVDKAKKVMQIGSGAGSNAISAKARELVKSGAIGKISMVRMENNRNSPEGAWLYAVPPDASPQTIDWDRFIGPSPQKSFDPNIFFRWRCWWEYSGGVATDLFVHMLTQLHEVMDVPAPKSVVSQGGIYRWNDGRTVPDLLSSLYDYGGFLADLSVNLGNAHGSRGMLILGSEGSLQINARGVTHYTEVKSPDIQRYATNSWPEAMKKQYYESRGVPASGRFPFPQAPKPKEVVAERGPGHQELFTIALRDGGKSRENHWQGHAAAGSAHLANLAFRNGRRMSWDWKTGTVS